MPAAATPDLFTPADLAGDADERRALVALSLVPGVGPGRALSLVRHLGSATAVLAAPTSLLSQVPGVGPQTAAAVRRFDDYAAVEAQLAQAEQVGATLVPAWDDRYPPLLRQIYDPPAFLWLRGELRAADELALAIVGTRRATDYGRRQAQRFAAELAERGFTIVSGLAYGIDKAAHEAALDAGGRTVAVLGSGVDRIYPARHTRLVRRMLDEGVGAVLSEYALGAAPDAVNFPRRNRIVSGLALGTLVVEAFEKGGALITARLAVEQNREVFAVPSPVYSPAGVGTNRLIQRGHAKLVLTVDDILDELGMLSDAAPAPAAAAPPDLNGVEQRLYDALGPAPTPLDALCASLDLDPSSALVYLLGLEFKGLVHQMAGQQFYRVG